MSICSTVLWYIQNVVLCFKMISCRGGGRFMHRSKYRTLFFRSRRELPPDFLGRKGGAFYAPVCLIDTKRRQSQFVFLSSCMAYHWSFNTITQWIPLVEQELLTLLEYICSPPFFCSLHIAPSLVYVQCFVDDSLYFCPCSFGHCIVGPSSNYLYLMILNLTCIINTYDQRWSIPKLGYYFRAERHIHLQIIVSVNQHYKYLAHCVGLVQK